MSDIGLTLDWIEVNRNIRNVEKLSAKYPKNKRFKKKLLKLREEEKELNKKRKAVKT